MSVFMIFYLQNFCSDTMKVRFKVPNIFDFRKWLEPLFSLSTNQTGQVDIQHIKQRNGNWEN